MDKQAAGNLGDAGSIPGSERSSEEGKAYPLQFSCLENPMDREAWQSIVRGVQRVGHDLVINPFFLLPQLELNPHWYQDIKLRKIVNSHVLELPMI